MATKKPAAKKPAAKKPAAKKPAAKKPAAKKPAADSAPEAVPVLAATVHLGGATGTAYPAGTPQTQELARRIPNPAAWTTANPADPDAAAVVHAATATNDADVKPVLEWVNEAEGEDRIARAVEALDANRDSGTAPEIIEALEAIVDAA